MNVEKKKKRLRFNRKSCTAMLLAVTLLCTSVDYMQIQAKEMEDQLPTVSEVELPGNPDAVDEETADAKEGSFVKTSEGAVIISSFASLSENDAHIVLEERETLEGVIQRMPSTLQAYADVYVQGGSEPDEGDNEEDKPDEGDNGEDKLDEGDGEDQPDEGDNEGDKPDEGDDVESWPDEDDNKEEKPDEGGNEAEKPDEDGNEDGQPDEGSGEADRPDTGESGENRNGEDESQSGADTETAADIASANWEGHRWHLLVAAEDVESESSDVTDESGNSEGEVSGVSGIDESDGNASSEDDGSTSENESAASEGDSSTSEDGGSTSEGGDGTGADTDEPVLSTQSVEVEIPVSWVCSDYENTELTEYIFRPMWDNALWFYEAGETADSVPVITVSYFKIVKEEVSTQEELAAAFAAGVDKITLTADIALTTTLRLPASADIELDGQGHSLLRGKEENRLFIGTMISMDGEDYTEETYGTLTLKNITVDGKTPTDDAGAPVILDCGNLILEKDAVVRDNYNYGTYPSGGEDAETILDYGGGIQVYGQMSVTEESLVTGNFADELGGGVYLASGATLYLYADKIRENSVSEDAGYGADLYAANGSTIYYDSSIDMERDGFYLCAGVILIYMQGQKAVRTADSDRQDNNVEIFISAAEGSGYDDKFLEALKRKLESDYGYSVIPKMAQVDTSDLREWYAYDHYDTDAACWGTATDDDGYGNQVPKEWLSVYGDYPRRRYYSYSEYYCANLGTIEDPKPATKVYSIADWLNNADYQDTRNAYHLAQFKEHIYNHSPNMTFVGYGKPAYIDFMFYDPQSSGEKIVDFDINSSQVISHALSGMGFLVNTGLKDGKLYGYLVYYYYENSKRIPGDKPTMLYVFSLDGVDVESFHGGQCDFKSILKGADSDTELRNRGITRIGDGVSIDSSQWDSRMSIRIQISPTKIEIRQQPGNAATDIVDVDPLSWTVEDKGCNGFGPLMAYTSYGHSCSLASCFTYSNIHMRYTNPIQANQNMLQPIEFADYTQGGTQKYFLNLFGTTDQGYNNEGVETNLYQEYLKLMQTEGVALITDRETPFADYLGQSGEAGANLFELGRKGDGALDVDALAAKIAEYIGKQHTTYMEHKLLPDGSGELKNANPEQAVGNIWLESETDGGQVRAELQGDSFTDAGYKIKIRDDIAYYYGNRDDYNVTYEITKPNGDVLKLPDGDTSFIVGKKYWEWPPGRYTVKQTITGSYGESTVHGYAYFDLKRTVGENCSHVWGDLIRELEPSCTTEGRETRYCSICGMPRLVSIPALGHSISEEWEVNPIEHWHECSRCNEKFDVNFHQFGEWITDEEATEEKNGSRYRLCADCSYKDLESIKRGKITKREDCGENAPQTEITTELPALALAVLSDDDAHAVGNGTDITIVLTVEDADNTVSTADQEAVASAAKSYKVGQYFDVNLYKEMNGGRTQVTETSDELRLNIEVPEKYRKAARKYAIVRLHNGEAVALMDLDSESSTVTIDTDRFSTYALVYADRRQEGGTDSDSIEEGQYSEQEESDYIVSVNYQGSKEELPESRKDSEPRTGQTSHVELYATIAFIEGASYLLFLFAERHGMTEETKTELVSRLIRWAKRGGKLRRMLALAAIFLLLVYYHSIGKQVSMEWKQVCNG